MRISSAGRRITAAARSLPFAKAHAQTHRVLCRKALAGMSTFGDDCRHDFEHSLGWLQQWACSRAFGLGTRVPTYLQPTPPVFACCYSCVRDQTSQPLWQCAPLACALRCPHTWHPTPPVLACCKSCVCSKTCGLSGLVAKHICSKVLTLRRCRGTQSTWWRACPTPLSTWPTTPWLTCCRGAIPLPRRVRPSTCLASAAVPCFQHVGTHWTCAATRHGSCPGHGCARCAPLAGFQTCAPVEQDRRPEIAVVCP